MALSNLSLSFFLTSSIRLFCLSISLLLLISCGESNEPSNNSPNAAESQSDSAVTTYSNEQPSLEIFTTDNLNEPIIAVQAIQYPEIKGSDQPEFQTLEDDEYYLVKLSNVDIEALYSGDSNTEQIGENITAIHALALGKDIKSTFNISVLSDLAWRYTKANIETMAPSDISLRQNDIAKALLADPIVDNAGAVSGRDLLAFNPSITEHKESLNFNYEILKDKDKDNTSILDNYPEGDNTQLEKKLNSRFSDRLSFYAPKNEHASSIRRVEVIPFGKGSFKSLPLQNDQSNPIDFTHIDYDPDREKGNRKTYFFDTNDISNENLTIQAIPIEGEGDRDTEILSWGGCNSVSADKTQCTVSLKKDHQITVSFGYKKTILESDITFVDLSDAWVTSFANDKLIIQAPDASTDIGTKLASLKAMDYITGSYGDGFLLQVSAITQSTTDNITYYTITTQDAALDDIVKQGTAVLSRTITHRDIENLTEEVLPTSATSNTDDTASISRINPVPFTPFNAVNTEATVKEIPFSDIKGVKLIPSADNNNQFTIKIGNEPASTQTTSRALNLDADSDASGTSFSKDVVLVKKNGKDIVTASGEINLDLSLDMGVSYGFFSGLEYFKLIPTLDMSESLDLTIGADELEYESKTVKLGTMTLTRLIFWMGPIPIYIKPLVEIHMGFDGEITAAVSTGISFSQQVRAGVIFSAEDGFSSVGDFNTGVEFSKPSEDYPKAEFRGIMRIAPSIFIYGKVGPSFPITSYLKLSMDVDDGQESQLIDTNRQGSSSTSCKGGFNNAAWAGIEGEMVWDLFFDPKEGNKLSRIIGKYISQIDTTVDLFQIERLLTRWDSSVACAEAKMPSKLSVKGENYNIKDKISDFFTYDPNNVSFYLSTFTDISYTLTNEGDLPLYWEARTLSDNDYLTFSPSDGRYNPIAPGASVKVSAWLNYNDHKYKLGETYETEFSFINLSNNTPAGNDFSRKVTFTPIPEKINPPKNFRIQISSNNTANFSWDPPDTKNAIAKSLILGYRIYQSLDKQDWESIAAIEGVDNTTYTTSGASSGTHNIYYKIDAYSKYQSSETEWGVPDGFCGVFFDMNLNFFDPRNSTDSDNNRSLGDIWGGGWRRSSSQQNYPEGKLHVFETLRFPGEGEYPDLNKTFGDRVKNISGGYPIGFHTLFPNASYPYGAGFSSILIGANTTVEYYPDNNFINEHDTNRTQSTTTPIITIKGPAMVYDHLTAIFYQGLFSESNIKAPLFEPWNTLYPEASRYYLPTEARYVAWGRAQFLSDVPSGGTVAACPDDITPYIGDPPGTPTYCYFFHAGYAYWPSVAIKSAYQVKSSMKVTCDF